MRTKISMMIILSLFTFTTSCGDIKNTIKIRNIEWWVDKGGLGAKSFNTLNSNSRTKDKTTWDRDRFGMVCGAPPSIGELLSEIEQFCNTFNNCDYETQQNVNLLIKKINYITIKAKSPYEPLREVNFK